jgi:hypothetical protein
LFVAVVAAVTVPQFVFLPQFPLGWLVGCGGDGEISPNVEGNGDENDESE